LYGNGVKTGRTLDDIQQAQLYDHVMKPTLDDICPADVTRWPISYGGANWTNRTSRGYRLPITIAVAHDDLPDFGKGVLTKLHQLPWGRNAFFHHEVKGIKTSNTHDPTSAADRENWLGVVLRDFYVDKLEGQDWVIDVGLSYSYHRSWNGHLDPAQSEALFWKKDAHLLIVSELCNVELGAARKIASGDRQRTDLVAGFTNVAGFATVLTRSQQKKYGIYYINCYTSEKVPVAISEGKFHAKTAFPKEWVKSVSKGEKYKYPQELVERLEELGRHRCAVIARLEIRVDLFNALDRHLKLNVDTLRRSIIKFDSGDFW
jgi:hypothetical protein